MLGSSRALGRAVGSYTDGMTEGRTPTAVTTVDLVSRAGCRYDSRPRVRGPAPLRQLRKLHLLHYCFEILIQYFIDEPVTQTVVKCDDDDDADISKEVSFTDLRTEPPVMMMMVMMMMMKIYQRRFRSQICERNLL